MTPFFHVEPLYCMICDVLYCAPAMFIIAARDVFYRATGDVLYCAPAMFIIAARDVFYRATGDVLYRAICDVHHCASRDISMRSPPRHARSATVGQDIFSDHAFRFQESGASSPYINTANNKGCARALFTGVRSRRTKDTGRWRFFRTDSSRNSSSSAIS